MNEENEPEDRDLNLLRRALFEGLKLRLIFSDGKEYTGKIQRVDMTDAEVILKEEDGKICSGNIGDVMRVEILEDK